MAKSIKEYIEEINEGVKALFTSDSWKNYLTFLSRFHSYSVNNTIAIYMQRPDASLVASFTDWQRNGRYVMKGERGIRIIAPHTYKAVNHETGEEEQRLGFHLTHCFDVSQTDGKDLPESPCRELTDDVEDYVSLRDTLCQISPVPVRYGEIAGDANGYYSHRDLEIVVRDSLRESQKIKTTIHEIAHAWLHAKGADEEKADRYTREVQAESVAYTVCQYLGIDSSDYSFGYIAGWSKTQELDELKKSIDAITKTSNRIISDIEDVMQKGAEAA